MTEIAIHHAGLSVSDFDRAVDWWRDHFGFALEREWMADGTRIGIIAHGTARLELFEQAGAGAGPDEAGDLMGSFARRGWKHVALQVDDVDATFARLRDAGVPVLLEPTSNAAAGLRFAFLRDPDGTHVEVLTPL